MKSFHSYMRASAIVVNSLIPGLMLSAAGIARAAVSPALPVIPETVFSITNYGAIGDGVATNTVAIQAAIDAASAKGGGIVEVPRGTYLSGPIRLDSKIKLQVD